MASQAAHVGARAGRRPGAGAVLAADWTAPDVRRRLQLALAGVWLLDGILQVQAVMFTRGFSRMLGGTAAGNPAVIADPINWSARFIAVHPAANAIFALIQVAIGIGIAWRPALRLALGASVVWSLGVWWFGEGLGGVLNGTASPVNGAPGAVMLYALLAVLLWPAAGGDRAAPFVAGRFTGAHVARALWLVLWGSLAYLALLPATKAPNALGGMVTAMASGEPGWLSSLDHQLGAFLDSNGPAMAVVLATGLALVAVSAYLPRPAARAGVVLAIGIAAFVWIAEGLGGMLASGATDPNSGPLLALLALAYWPLAPAARSGAREPELAATARPPSPEGA